jgi:predicted membrane GTPase involved in stress response
MLVSNMDYDAHKGKHAIGRIRRGNIAKGQNLNLIDAMVKKFKAKPKVFDLSHGLKKLRLKKHMPEILLT